MDLILNEARDIISQAKKENSGVRPSGRSSASSLLNPTRYFKNDGYQKKSNEHSQNLSQSYSNSQMPDSHHQSQERKFELERSVQYDKRAQSMVENGRGIHVKDQYDRHE